MQAEAREIVRKVIKEGLYKKGNAQPIFVDGVEVQVHDDKEGNVQFDVPRQEKSFILMSGRLYERPFTMREGVEGSGTLTDPERTTIVEQMNYKGEMEKIDTRVFKNKLTCSCGNVRWVKSSDLFQVKKCKPCTYKERNKRRKTAF